MNIRKTLLLTSFISLISISTSAQYIRVNDTYTPQQLVENVLVNNSCVAISNISVSGGNFAGGEQSYGYFDGSGTTFALQNGVILSTGRAVKAVGPNTSLLDDGNNMNWGGDNDLQRALDINNSTNATVLEFDFMPLTNNISFKYLLSSEEYHDNAPCNYSDGFAFLLKEADNPTAPYNNLAVIPGTDIPVKVTSVRPLIPGGSGCPARNEQYFDAFNGTQHPTNFNGQTKVMTAASQVVPGLKYHIKLVIADEGNYRYDSAIFLGGGSFESEIDLGGDRLFATNNPLCYNEPYLLNATSASATGYQWYLGTNPIVGATSPTYTAIAAGTYKVIVNFGATCSAEGEIKLEYSSALNFGTYTLLQCDDNNDGLTTYNLNVAGELAKNGDNTLTVGGYFLSSSNAQNNIPDIQNVSAFNNTIRPQPIYIRLQNQYGCVGIAQVNLDIASNTLTPPDPFAKCDDDGILDGFTTFDLTTKNSEILQSLPSTIQLNYYTTMNDAITSSNVIGATTAFPNTVVYGQTVYARLSQGTDCYGIVPLQLQVYRFGNDIKDEEIILCNNIPELLDAGSGYDSYSWNTTPIQITQQITATTAGTYTVTVTNSNGCEAKKTFTVKASEKATITGIDINDFNGGFNTVTVNTSGIGDYEYSLGGTDWQESNIFTSVPTGIFIIYVRDTNQCGLVVKEVFVLDYPKFFTPNADGSNDYWHIPYITKRPNVRVDIFDRYGKLIYMFTGGSATQGWDGTLKGHPLPATDYWFTITLENGRIVRGHFSLIR